MKDENIINLLHKQRKYYEKQKKLHYVNFAVLTLILLLDFIIIMFTKMVVLNAYAWAGIIFLFVLIGVEANRYNDSKKLVESVDEFYLEGEYETKKKDKPEIEG